MEQATSDQQHQRLLFNNCPIVFEWCEYKGEVFFGSLNYERSIKAKKPMIDLCYCATKALNNLVIKTVQYDKSKFKRERDIKQFR